MNAKSDTQLSNIPHMKPVPVSASDESDTHGLALPDIGLKKIPPSPDYQQTLEKALSTSRVKTILPNLFNPLFRKQGPVNTLLIDALDQVGGFVKTLAEEIQARDKVIEKLVEHTNCSNRRHDSQISVVAQNLTGMFEYLEQLGHSLEGSSSKLSVMARETSVRFSGFLSNMKAGDARTAELEEITLQELPKLRSAIECHQQDIGKLHSDSDDLAESIRKAEEETARSFDTSSKRIDGLSDTIDEQIRTLSEATDQKIPRLEEELAGREAEMKPLRNQIGLLTRQLAEETEARSADRETLTVLANRVATLSLQVEEGFKRNDTATDTLGTEFEDKMAPLRESQSTLLATVRGAVENADLARDNARRSLSQVEELATLASERLGVFDRETRQQGEKIMQVLSRENDILNEARQSNERLKQDLVNLTDGLARISERLDAAESDAQRVYEIDENVDRLTTDLALQKATILSVLGEWETTFRKTAVSNADKTASAKAVALIDRARKKVLDTFYRDFEARFRGSREEIATRQAAHLPLLDESLERSGRDRESFRVLDLGCGRGEWLQHLKQEGFPAEGIDTNKTFLTLCRRRRLKVHDDDVISALRVRDDSSLGVVSAFHLIEHLPWTDWLELITQAYRVLIPGGLILLESPNPQNLIVGGCNFYMDPTHRNPLPPMTVEFALEHAGFADVRTDGLNPFEPEVRISPEETEVERRFNQFMYGPRDYAAVGWKPQKSKARI